jgi:hypothetical protein
VTPRLTDKMTDGQNNCMLVKTELYCQRTDEYSWSKLMNTLTKPRVYILVTTSPITSLSTNERSRRELKIPTARHLNFVTSPRKQRGFLNDDDTIASSGVTITTSLPLAQYYVPDPLLLRKSGSTKNRTRDLWIYSQELWPLDHRGGQLPQKYFSWVFIL